MNTIVLAVALICQSGYNAGAKEKYQRDCCAKILKCFVEKQKTIGNDNKALSECLEFK